MAESFDADSVEAFSRALGYTFTDVSLLELALTHRSYCAENDGEQSNERLEFLGDAVVGLVITEALYRNEPGQAEGELAKARAEVVSAPCLADLARSVGLGPLLRLGRGEDLSDGRNKESILADAIEAVVGAAYLDSDFATVQTIVEDLLGNAVAQAQVRPGVRDYKTRLQEMAAEYGHPAPSYLVSSSGPDHGRRFSATVTVGTITGSGDGSSKKQAQQRAAAEAIVRVEAAGPASDGADAADPTEVAEGAR